LERWLPPALLLAGLALWEVAARAGWISALFFPPPSAITLTLLRMVGGADFWAGLGSTLMRLTAGVLIGGGAELALDTNAVMLPVFHSMTLGGHINVEFHEPLTCASSLNRTQQVDELTRQYAALLIGHLPTLVSNMRWYKLRQFQEYSNTAKR